MNIDGKQRRISFFNYDKKGTPKSKPLTKADLQNRAKNRFLDENYNFNRFLEQKDGGSGIDKALSAKHRLTTKTSAKALKANKLQMFL